MRNKHRIASGQRQASRSRAQGLLLHGVVEDHCVGARGRVQRLAGQEAVSAKAAVLRKAAWYLCHACISFILPACISPSPSPSPSPALQSVRVSLRQNDAARSQRTSSRARPCQSRFRAAARGGSSTPLGSCRAAFTCLAASSRAGADAPPQHEGCRRMRQIRSPFRHVTRRRALLREGMEHPARP